MKSKEIKPKEYWLIKGGELVFVLHKSENYDSWWFVDKVDNEGEEIQDLSVTEDNFERKLSVQEVQELIEDLFAKRAKKLFEKFGRAPKSKLCLIQGVFSKEFNISS